MSEKVLKIVPPVRGEPNAACIMILEEALERARSGETIGAIIVEQHADNSSNYSCGGLVGSYSMLGSLQVIQQIVVMDHMRDDF